MASAYLASTAAMVRRSFSVRNPSRSAACRTIEFHGCHSNPRLPLRQGDALIRLAPAGYYPQAMKAARESACATASAASSRAWASARPCTGAPWPWAWADSCATSAPRSWRSWKAPGKRWRSSRRRCGAQLPPAARLDSVRAEAAGALRGRGLPHRGEPAGRLPFPADPARPGHLCGQCAAELLDPGTAATCTPSSPAPSAARATPSWSARPSTGKPPPWSISTSARNACGNTGIRTTGASTPRPTPALPAGPGCRLTDADGRPLPGRPAAVRRWRPCGQGQVAGPAGHRRFPPGGRPARRRGGGPPATGQGPRAQALRPHGRGPAGGPSPCACWSQATRSSWPPPPARS